MSLELRDAEFIRLDLFPAEVSIVEIGNTDTFDEEVRVIVTNDTLYIFFDGEKGPEVLVEEYITDFLGDNKKGWTVISSKDVVYHIKRAPTCGCGSRLRGFIPFPGVRHTLLR